jgi:hypothetical protein
MMIDLRGIADCVSATQAPVRKLLIDKGLDELYFG